MKGAWFDQAGCLKVYIDNQEALKTNREHFCQIVISEIKTSGKTCNKIYCLAIAMAGRSKLQIVQQLDLVIGSMMTTIMLLMRMLMTPEQTVAVHNYVFAMRNSGGDAAIVA